MSKFNSEWIDRNTVYVPSLSAPAGTPRYARVERPVIVCLCGSTRFFSEFLKANYAETMSGKIVLSVGHFPNAPQEAHGESVGCTPQQKVELDELHKRKIDLADEVFVLNVGGYVGDSTRSEVLYAKRDGKPIRWLEPDKVPADLA